MFTIKSEHVHDVLIPMLRFHFFCRSAACGLVLHGLRTLSKKAVPTSARSVKWFPLADFYNVSLSHSSVACSVYGIHVFCAFPRMYGGMKAEKDVL
jgi:hypothetical protein